jgi:putative methyltransferase (TIGR04325 family)
MTSLRSPAKMLHQIKFFAKSILLSVRSARDAGRSGFSGPYRTWDAAAAAAVGFDSPYVLDKVRSAVESVLRKDKAYERDGTAFDQMPDKCALRLQIKSLLKRDSVVVDFGGGLGGTFVNNLDLFSRDWCGQYFIVEQPNFCRAGAEISEKFNLPLTYLGDLGQAPPGPSILIASGVLAYIPNWLEVVSVMLDKKPECILVDRQLLSCEETRIFVQENDGYYEKKVSYPLRIINRDEFLAAFTGYEVVNEWQSDFDPDGYLGFLLRKAL